MAAVSLGPNSVVWSLMVVMHAARIVEEVDDVRLDKIGVTKFIRSGARSASMRRNTLRLAVLTRTMLQGVRVEKRRNRSVPRLLSVHVDLRWRKPSVVGAVSKAVRVGMLPRARVSRMLLAISWVLRIVRVKWVDERKTLADNRWHGAI